MQNSRRVNLRQNQGKLWQIYNSLMFNFSKSGIQLGKILANNISFAKFAKVFPHQNVAPYSISLPRNF